MKKRVALLLPLLSLPLVVGIVDRNGISDSNSVSSFENYDSSNESYGSQSMVNNLQSGGKFFTYINYDGNLQVESTFFDSNLTLGNKEVILSESASITKVFILESEMYKTNEKISTDGITFFVMDTLGRMSSINVKPSGISINENISNGVLNSLFADTGLGYGNIIKIDHNLENNTFLILFDNNTLYSVGSSSTYSEITSDVLDFQLFYTDYNGDSTIASNEYTMFVKNIDGTHKMFGKKLLFQGSYALGGQDFGSSYTDSATGITYEYEINKIFLSDDDLSLSGNNQVMIYFDYFYSTNSNDNQTADIIFSTTQRQELSIDDYKYSINKGYSIVEIENIYFTNNDYLVIDFVDGKKNILKYELDASRTRFFEKYIDLRQDVDKENGIMFNGIDVNGVDQKHTIEKILPYGNSVIALYDDGSIYELDGTSILNNVGSYNLEFSNILNQTNIVNDSTSYDSLAFEIKGLFLEGKENDTKSIVDSNGLIYNVDFLKYDATNNSYLFVINGLNSNTTYTFTELKMVDEIGVESSYPLGSSSPVMTNYKPFEVAYFDGEYDDGKDEYSKYVITMNLSNIGDFNEIYSSNSYVIKVKANSTDENGNVEEIVFETSPNSLNNTIELVKISDNEYKIILKGLERGKSYSNFVMDFGASYTRNGQEVNQVFLESINMVNLGVGSVMVPEKGMPIWALVLSILAILIVFGIIIFFIVRMFRKKNKDLENSINTRESNLDLWVEEE